MTTFELLHLSAKMHYSLETVFIKAEVGDGLQNEDDTSVLTPEFRLPMWVSWTLTRIPQMSVDTGSPFLKGIIRVSYLNPWTWIAVIFALQTAGAVMVALLFKLNGREVALPIFLLLFGTLIALFERRFGSSTKSSVLRWAPAVIYAFFIFLLSHESFPDAQPTFDTNFFHPLEYVTLGLFVCWAWHPLMLRRGIFLFAAAVLSSGTLYGVADEVHQSFVPGRCMSSSDLAMDIFGLLLGCGAFLVVWNVQERLRMLVVETDSL